MVGNLNHIIDQVVKDKGIDRDVLVEALESAVLSAANKKFRNTRDLEAHFNEEIGEVDIFEFVAVVDEVVDSYKEIDIEEAREVDPDVEIGDSLGMLMEAGSFSRIAAQAAKQVIIQKVREAEREGVYNEFKDRVGEVVNGIVRRYERGDLIVDLGRAEALLPNREQVPRENYRQSDRVRAYISEVKMSAKGPQIILSRTHPGLLISLFKSEVPEIYEGIVEIKHAVREPGSRAKIAVVSHDIDVDPVGACVGMRGSRVQNVVTELRGERIDIIPWTPDPARFACAALAPAEVSRVYIDDEAEVMEVIVPDDQLSLAIGKKGQNVRLAAKLINWKIDIKSETRAQEEEQEEATPEETEPDETAEVVGEESLDETESVEGSKGDEAAAEEESAAVEEEPAAVEEESAAVEEELAAAEEESAAVEEESAAVEEEPAAVEEESAAADEEQAKE